MQKITIKTVAEKVGVSVSVVSRVLNGKAKAFRISEKTAARVEAVAKELGYMPSELARGFRLRKSFSLGLVFPTIKNPFFAEVASMLIEEARKRGYFLFVADGEEDPKIEKDVVNKLFNRGIDGLFILPGSKEHDYLEAMYNNGFPVVFIDRYVQNSKIPYIGSENYDGAYTAVRYLLNKGHRKIACIQGTRYAMSNKERISAYENAMNEVPNTKKWIVGASFTEQNGYIQTKRILTDAEKPTAIFAVNNLITLGVIKAVKEMDLKIPDDISLVSFDDHYLLEYLSPAITAITQPKKAIVDMALNVMLAQIEGKKIAQKRLEFPTKLNIRDSVSYKTSF